MSDEDRGTFPDDGPPSLDVLVAVHGGYHLITPEAWVAYDAAVVAWKDTLRLRSIASGVAVAPDLPLQIFPRLLDGQPRERCFVVGCYASAQFGYRQADGSMAWFCAAHRQAEWSADERR